jgi:hypothetical protein
MIAAKRPCDFAVVSGRQIRVHLRAPTKEEQEAGHKLGNALCESVAEFKASKKNEAVLKKIEQNAVWRPPNPWRQKYRGPDGTEITLPFFSDFPEHFCSFVQQARDELAAATRSIVGVLRWRTNIDGPHNPVGTRSLEWSWDGGFWHQGLLDFGADISFQIGHRFSSAIQSEVLQLVSETGNEPVYHELFREAWAQRANNPRSAIVTGVSAAEVAIKQCIGNLVPNAQWLVENVPSPPLEKLLSDYLPRLPARNNINGRVVSPPKSVLDVLRKAVFVRNQIAHVGAEPPSPAMIKEMLLAVRDVLWMIDYYLGYSWALENVRDESRPEMETPGRDN